MLTRSTGSHRYGSKVSSDGIGRERGGSMLGSNLEKCKISLNLIFITMCYPRNYHVLSRYNTAMKRSFKFEADKMRFSKMTSLKGD